MKNTDIFNNITNTSDKKFVNINFRNFPNTWKLMLDNSEYKDAPGNVYRILSGYDFSHSIMPLDTYKYGFDNCNLMHTVFIKSENFHNCGFSNSNMKGANLSEATIDQGYIKNSDCTNMNFERGHLYRSTNLTGSIFTYANFMNASLGYIDFANNKLIRTNFSKCFFCSIHFGKNIEFDGCTFEEARGKEIIFGDFFSALDFRKCNINNMRVEKVSGNIVGKLIVIWNGAYIGEHKYFKENVNHTIWKQRFYNFKNVFEM